MLTSNTPPVAQEKGSCSSAWTRSNGAKRWPCDASTPSPRVMTQGRCRAGTVGLPLELQNSNKNNLGQRFVHWLIFTSILSDRSLMNIDLRWFKMISYRTPQLSHKWLETKIILSPGVLVFNPGSLAALPCQREANWCKSTFTDLQSLTKTCKNIQKLFFGLRFLNYF